MAGRSNGGSWRVHSLFGPGEESGAGDEFDESDVWGLAPDPRLAESRKPAPPARAARKKPENCESNGAAAAAAASLPVNVPDWSKILRQEYRGNARSLVEEEDEDAGTGAVIPPHEFLWRKRAASFSVHEGVGRTLKGRDLRRVRNAVWAQTGFED